MTATLPARTRQDQVEPQPVRRAAHPLRLVQPGERDLVARRRRHRRLTVVAVAVAAATLLGVVASHVVLTQGQFRLQRLEERAGVEQARYERLRLRVAELESPARIVAAAQERLGMVPPPGVTYLSPTGVSGAVSSDDTAPTGSGSQVAMDDWSTVKRQLADR